MRLMSFALTTDQVRRREKTVTRRLKWLNLKAGDRLRAVVKAMGLKKGEKPEDICVIEVTGVRRESLLSIMGEPDGAASEGFPHLTNAEFMEMFCQHMKCDVTQTITRIEFTYVENGMTTEAPKRKRRKLPTPSPEQQAAKVAAKKRNAADDKPPQVEKSQEKTANGDELPKAERAIAPGKQQRIEGSYTPIPADLAKKANQYANKLHARMGLQAAEKVLKGELIDLMKKHGVDEIETDDSYVSFEHEEKDKIKVKKKKDEDD